MTDPWTSTDALGEALHALRMGGVFCARSEFSDPFGLEIPAMPGCLMFHAVSSGQCWLEIDGNEPLLLQPGDFVLVPHGEGHRLSSTPGQAAMALFDLPREAVSERYELLRHGGGGRASTVVCGAVRFDHPAAHHLVRLLPRHITIEPWSAGEWLPATLRFLATEAQAMLPGGETVITRLADILVIQTIRSWLAHNPDAQTGWLGALQDRKIGRAIARIHHDPARAWTVAELAETAAMSRSAFAARFAELVGETPMQYVGRWRMQLALAGLREQLLPIADVAAKLGYRSDAAFRRAFKRHLGFAPGAARRPSSRGAGPPSR